MKRDAETDSNIALELLRHPVRQRIVDWLSCRPRGHTQKDMGVALAMSTAAIHYHIKLLEGVGLARVISTRPGPNGITEKLYTVDPTAALSRKDQGAFYLESTFAHMQEMQREGETLLDMSGDQHGYVAGTFECYATQAASQELAARLLELVESFHAAHSKPKRGARPTSVTLGVLPSLGSGWTGKRRAVDFLSPSMTDSGDASRS